MFRYNLRLPRLKTVKLENGYDSIICLLNHFPDIGKRLQEMGQAVTFNLPYRKMAEKKWNSYSWRIVSDNEIRTR